MGLILLRKLDRRFAADIVRVVEQRAALCVADDARARYSRKSG